MRTKIVPLMVFFLGVLVALAGAAAAQSEDPNPEAPRWVEATYEISLDGELQTILLEGEVDVHKIQTSNRLLQQQCGGSTCSADDIRRAYQRAGDSGKESIVDAMESRIEGRVEAALAGLGASEVESTARVDEEALAEPPVDPEFQPPIPIQVDGSGELGFAEEAGVSPDQVAALFAMGAKVDQAVEVPVEPGTNLTLTLAVPSPLNVLEAEAGEIGGDGEEVTWTETNWRSASASSIEDEVRLGDPTVEVPTASDAHLGVTLDISEAGVEYGSLLGGDEAPGRANVALAVDGTFGAIENPRDVEEVDLPYLSADALRIALANDLLETRQLIGLEERARAQIQQAFEGMTGEDVRVGGGGFSQEDLSADAIGDPPGTGEAVELHLAANATVPFPPEEQPGGAQGFTVTTLSLGNLDLPDVDVPYDVDRSVTIVLPAGLDLGFDEPEGYTVTEEERDGRKAYTFSSNGDGDGDQAAIQNGEIVVNHPFVWDVFWPVLVTLALLLVVLPAVVIGLTIRRRRKRGPPTAGESAKPVSGSQATQRSESSEE